jgi:nitrogen fixation NifU-like protein
MYPARLLDHFQNPRQVGELPPPAITVEVTNPACGDILRLSVRVDGERAAEVRFKARGCTASIAAGSAAAEWLTGRTWEEMDALEPTFIADELGGLNAESQHAAALVVDAVRKLLKDWRAKRAAMDR